MTATAILAALIVLPWLVGGYGVYLLSLTAVYTLVAVGLNLLTGLTGQISLGHAAFFAIGAYGTGLLAQRAGIPMPLALLLAGLLSAAVGALAALPALRLRNLYLAIATLGLGTVVQKTLFEWRSVTGGGGGLTLAPPHVAGIAIGNGIGLYYVVLLLAAAGLWAASNLVRGRSGRAMRLLRESEVAAGTLGIPVAQAKVTAFALSAFYAAIAGGLYGYVVGYVSPEGFGIALSISFISMIVIGGLGSSGGPVLGAAFYVLLPEVFSRFKDAPGLVFGIALMLTMVFLPDGLWGLPARLRGRP